MSQSKPKLTGILLLAVMSLHNPSALALFEPGVGIGLEYTDNAGLTPSNESDDLVALGYVGANIELDSGPLNFSAVTALSYESYTDSTFSDQTYAELNATAGWEMVRDRLDLRVRDFFSQRLSNSDDRSTPNNIENVNIFSLVPDITIPVSRVQKLLINPEFNDFYYENSDTDNQRYSLTVDWLYETSATNVVGLGGAVSKVDFEDQDINPNFLANNIHAIVSGELARSKYTLNLGFTQIDRDDVENRSAPTGRLDWVLGLTGRSEARLYLASDLTDASFSALGSALDPGRGDINNVQISGDVFRNNILRVTYLRKGVTLRTRLWGEIRDLDYKETPQDREIQSLGIQFDYRMRALVTSRLYSQYKRTKRTEQDRTDKWYIVGGEIGYQMSRKLRTVLNVQYQDKDSTIDFQEFSELSGLINLVYGYGEMERKRSSRSF